MANEPVVFEWETSTVTVIANASGQATLNLPVNRPARTDTVRAGVAGAASATLTVEFLAPETTAPQVTAASPTGTGIDPPARVVVNFSERIHPSTLTTATLQLRTGTVTGAVVPATVQLAADRLSATLVPSAPLASDTAYIILVTTGVTDLVGNRIAVNFTASFRTRDFLPPPTPTNLRATPGVRRVDLTWTAVAAADLAGCIVTINGVRVTATPITVATYSARTLVTGVTYRFGVAAIDRSGNVSAQVRGPQPLRDLLLRHPIGSRPANQRPISQIDHSPNFECSPSGVAPCDALYGGRSRWGLPPAAPRPNRGAPERL